MNRRLPQEQEPNPLARLLDEKRRAGHDILDLTVTNPTLVGLLALDAEALATLATPSASRYDPEPSGMRSAREAVAHELVSPGPPADPERIFLTASSSESYAHLFRLLCEPGDNIVVPRPSYPLLEPIARLEGVRLESYRLAYDGRWRLDLDSLEAAVGARTRAIVLVEPNNPTGSVLAPEERGAVEALAERRGVALISDEVFREFPWEEQRVLPTWCGTRTVPTFALGGISKSCGLPQLKLGWIALSGPAAAVERHAAGLEWILDLFLSVGTPVQLALPFLLARRNVFQEALLARVRSNLDAWRIWTSRNGGTLLHADGGWSAMIRLDTIPEAGRDLAEWALDRADVFVHPAHYYDLDDDRHVIASLLPEPVVLAQALRRLEHGIDSPSRA